MDNCKDKIDLGHYWDLKGYSVKKNAKSVFRLKNLVKI